jgi:hypothetical protein
VPPMTARLSRAQLLTGGAGTAVALLSAGGGLATFAANAGATPPNDALGALSAPDLAYVRLLVGVELLMTDFYGHALGSGHLNRANADVMRLALANEQAHYTYLAGVMAGSGEVAATAADLDFSYPSGAFFTARSVTRLAVTLERLALGTYLGAGGGVANAALAQGLSQIAANEAQHLSVISLNDRTAAFQDAFPATMTMEDSSNALGNYTA